MDVRHEHWKKRSSQYELFLLSFFWLGYQFFITSTSVLVLPNEVAQLTDSNWKGTGLGILMAVGFGTNMLCNPLFGAWSDNYSGVGQRYFGRRIPFLAVGAIGMIGSLLLLAGLSYLQMFPVLVVTWALVMFFASVGQAPYSALMPDRVLREQYGSASGWMAVMTVVGNAIGASLGFFLDDGGVVPTLFIIVAALTVCALVTIVSGYALGVDVIDVERKPPAAVREGHACSKSLSSLWDNLRRPFSGGDFTWLFFSRVLVGMGYYTIQQFILYYVSDVVHKPYLVNFFGIASFVVPDDKSAAALYMLFMLTSAVISALIAGRLSDRVGAKIIVYISCTLQSIAVILIVLPWLHRLDAVLFVSLLFGAGYGAYQSVDWALAMDVLPSNFEFGKDMGIWHISWVLPQMVVSLLGGIVLDALSGIGKHINYPELGYTVIFASAVLWFLSSMATVSKIELTNRKTGLALDPFFQDEVTWKNDEVLLNIGAASDSASEVDGFDSTESSSEGSLSGDSGSSSELVNAEKFKASGVRALDDFVEGKIGVDDIDFEDHL